MRQFIYSKLVSVFIFSLFAFVQVDTWYSVLYLQDITQFQYDSFPATVLCTYATETHGDVLEAHGKVFFFGSH